MPRGTRGNPVRLPTGRGEPVGYDCSAVEVPANNTEPKAAPRSRASPLLRRGAGLTELQSQGVRLQHLHLTPHTALFSASKPPPQGQIPRSSHTYITSRFMGKDHGLPPVRRSCHSLFLSPGALQWWSVSDVHRAHIWQTPFKTCAPQAAEFRHQPLSERHKNTALPFSPILKSFHAEWCKYNPPVRAGGEAQAGLVSTKQQQKGSNQLRQKSSPAPNHVNGKTPNKQQCRIGSQELGVTILLFLCLPVQLSQGKKFPVCSLSSGWKHKKTHCAPAL